MNQFDLLRGALPLATPATAAVGSQTRTEGAAPKPGEFQKCLDDEIKFSQHAATRIQSRAIPWDAKLETRIKTGIDQASAKGSRQALLLADNIAVIANVKTRTIVTAMDRDQMKDKIFTNIDSAVLV